MKRLVLGLAAVGMLSCGSEREEREVKPGLEGSWYAYGIKCERSIYFFEDHFFKEKAYCKNKSESHVSKGIWTRSPDNVLQIEYIDSTRPDLNGVRTTAIFELDDDRIVITNLKETTILKRCGDTGSICGRLKPGGGHDVIIEQPEDPTPNVVINNNNNNTNNNTCDNTNTNDNNNNNKCDDDKTKGCLSKFCIGK